MLKFLWLINLLFIFVDNKFRLFNLNCPLIYEKITYFLLCFCFALNVHAQNKYQYGLSLSADFIDIKTVNSVGNTILPKPDFSSSLGGYLRKQLSENIALRVDLGYQLIRYDYTVFQSNNKYSEHNLYAILTPQYKVFNNFHIGCGLTFNGYLNGSNLIRPFARWAINPELQYQFKKWSLGARYSSFFTPFRALEYSESYWRTTSIFLTYQLGTF